jgi:hypothetical protein
MLFCKYNLEFCAGSNEAPNPPCCQSESPAQCGVFFLDIQVCQQVCQLPATRKMLFDPGRLSAPARPRSSPRHGVPRVGRWKNSWIHDLASARVESSRKSENAKGQKRANGCRTNLHFIRTLSVTSGAVCCYFLPLTAPNQNEIPKCSQGRRRCVSSTPCCACATSIPR